MKSFIDRIFYGSILMSLTGIGVFFIGAVPIITMFGGFPANSTNMGDSLASVGISFVVGVILYVLLFSYLIHLYF